MYLAHVLGEHQFVNQGQSLGHVLSNWGPIVLGIVFVAITAWSIIHRHYQTELVRIRNK